MSASMLEHWPFFLVNYGLAVVMWSCVGRFMLFFIPALQPGNYIYRAFRALTEWAVWLARWITPSHIRPLWLPLIAAFWLWHVRLGLYFLMASYGLTPKLAAG